MNPRSPTGVKVDDLLKIAEQCTKSIKFIYSKENIESEIKFIHENLKSNEEKEIEIKQAQASLSQLETQQKDLEQELKTLKEKEQKEIVKNNTQIADVNFVTSPTFMEKTKEYFSNLGKKTTSSEIAKLQNKDAEQKKEIAALQKKIAAGKLLSNDNRLILSDFIKSQDHPLKQLSQQIESSLIIRNLNQSQFLIGDKIIKFKKSFESLKDILSQQAMIYKQHPRLASPKDFIDNYNGLTKQDFLDNYGPEKQLTNLIERINIVNFMVEKIEDTLSSITMLDITPFDPDAYDVNAIIPSKKAPAGSQVLIEPVIIVPSSPSSIENIENNIIRRNSSPLESITNTADFSVGNSNFFINNDEIEKQKKLEKGLEREAEAKRLAKLEKKAKEAKEVNEALDNFAECSVFFKQQITFCFNKLKDKTAADELQIRLNNIIFLLTEIDTEKAKITIGQNLHDWEIELRKTPINPVSIKASLENIEVQINNINKLYSTNIKTGRLGITTERKSLPISIQTGNHSHTNNNLPTNQIPEAKMPSAYTPEFKVSWLQRHQSRIKWIALAILFTLTAATITFFAWPLVISTTLTIFLYAAATAIVGVATTTAGNQYGKSVDDVRYSKQLQAHNDENTKLHHDNVKENYTYEPLTPGGNNGTGYIINATGGKRLEREELDNNYKKYQDTEINRNNNEKIKAYNPYTTIIQETTHRNGTIIEVKKIPPLSAADEIGNRKSSLGNN